MRSISGQRRWIFFTLSPPISAMTVMVGWCGSSCFTITASELIAVQTAPFLPCGSSISLPSAQQSSAGWWRNFSTTARTCSRCLARPSASDQSKPCRTCPSQMPAVTVRPSFCAASSVSPSFSSPQSRTELPPALAIDSSCALPPPPFTRKGWPSRRSCQASPSRVRVTSPAPAGRASARRKARGRGNIKGALSTGCDPAEASPTNSGADSRENAARG